MIFFFSLFLLCAVEGERFQVPVFTRYGRMFVTGARRLNTAPLDQSRIEYVGPLGRRGSVSSLLFSLLRQKKSHCVVFTAIFGCLLLVLGGLV